MSTPVHQFRVCWMTMAHLPRFRMLEEGQAAEAWLGECTVLMATSFLGWINHRFCTWSGCALMAVPYRITNSAPFLLGRSGKLTEPMPLIRLCLEIVETGSTTFWLIKKTRVVVFLGYSLTRGLFESLRDENRPYRGNRERGRKRA